MKRIKGWKNSHDKRDIWVYFPLPAYLKKKEERMPCAALLQMRNIVALECPRRISKLSGPVNAGHSKL